MSKRKKVVIIHFQPLELFPPVMNMIDFLSKENTIQLQVVSNKIRKENKLRQYNPPNSNVQIYRPSQQADRALERYLNYFIFYCSSFFLLIKIKPDVVWYFETLSSWPALTYKKLKKNRVNLMVHYHEYTEPVLYKQGMALARWMHRIESKMYRKFSWISHTNPVRLQMFKDDNNLNDMPLTVFHAIPNYPSKSWQDLTARDDSNSKQKKLVFVGSLGYKNMYLQEVVDWLSKYKDFSLDVYSYNIDEKAKQLLIENENSNIRYFGGCDYYALPQILNDYNIGLVIYKPFSQNTIHAVSNKVFEYLACGLDVWFSEDMTYTFEYERKNVYPKVLPVNFKKLDKLDTTSAISRAGLEYEQPIYFYEDIYPEITQHISNT